MDLVVDVPGQCKKFPWLSLLDICARQKIKLINYPDAIDNPATKLRSKSQGIDNLSKAHKTALLAQFDAPSRALAFAKVTPEGKSYICFILLLMPVLDVDRDKVVTLVYLSGRKLYTKLKPKKKPVQSDDFIVNSDKEEPDAEYTESHTGDNVDEETEVRTPLAGRTRKAKGKERSVDPFTLMGTPAGTKREKPKEGTSVVFGVSSVDVRVLTVIGTKQASPPIDDSSAGTPKRRRESAAPSVAAVPPTVAAAPSTAVFPAVPAASATQTTPVEVFGGSNAMSSNAPMEYYPAPSLNAPVKNPHRGMWGYGAPGTFNGAPSVPSMHPSNPSAHPNFYPYNPQFDTGQYWGYGPPQSYPPHPMYPYLNPGPVSGGAESSAAEEAK